MIVNLIQVGAMCVVELYRSWALAPLSRLRASGRRGHSSVSTDIGSGGYGGRVRLRFVGLLWLVMAALTGCVGGGHPADGAAGGRPEQAPAGSAGAASPGASVRVLSYPEPLPDCEAVQ